jgi:hypothetical protein
MPPGGEMADGKKYARSLVKHKIRSIRNFYITCVGKRCTYIVQYIICVGKRNHTKAHSAVSEEHKKYKCKKKIPP